MSKNKQGLIEGGLILTLALVIMKILGFVFKYFINGIIEPIGYGYYTQAFSIYGVVYAISVTGFPIAISRIVSSYASQGRYRDVRRVVKVATRLFAVVGAIGTVVQIGVAFFVFKNMFAPMVYWGIVVSAPAVFFCCLLSAHRGYHQGLSNMKPTAISEVVEVLAKIAASLVLALLAMELARTSLAASGTVLGSVPVDADNAVLAMGAVGVMLGITVSECVAYLYLRFRYWRKGDTITKAQINASPEKLPDRTIAKGIMMVAIPIAIGAAALSLAGLIDAVTIKNNLSDIINSENRQVLIDSHQGYLDEYLEDLQEKRGLEEKPYQDIPDYLFGIYGYEGSMTALIVAFAATFGRSALPLISSLWVKKDMQGLKKNFDTALRMVSIIAAPMGFGCVFLAQPISRFISEDVLSGYIGAPILMLLGISGIFISLQGVVNVSLQGIGKQWTPVWLMMAGMVIKTVCNYVLVGIPQFNIKMAPVGNILCFGFIVFAGLIAVRIYTKQKINIWGSLIKPMLAGAITGVFALLAYNLASKVLGISSNTVCILGAVGAAVIVYVIVLGILKVLQREDVLGLPGGEKLAKTLEKLQVIG